VEARVVQQSAKGLHPEAALADVLMTIHAAAARSLRIVQMKCPDPIQAHNPIERLESRRVATLGTDVVTCGQKVARIETDTDTRGSIEMFEDRREVLESVSQIRPLAGGVLEEDHRLGVWPRPEQPVDGPRNEFEALRLAPGRVGPGVHDQALETKGVRAIQLGTQGVDRLRPQRRVGGRDIDQVAVVRNDGMDPGLVEPSAEERDLLRGQQPRPPLTCRFREDLQSVAAGCLRTIDRAWESARD
jgi:hypothetical protein